MLRAVLVLHRTNRRQGLLSHIRGGKRANGRPTPTEGLSAGVRRQDRYSGLFIAQQVLSVSSRCAPRWLAG